MTVLLLRPEHKVVSAQQAFAKAGIDAIGLALQHCLPVDNLVERTCEIAWNNINHVIFTSSVAAKWTLPLLPALNEQTHIYAIGEHTFQTLAQWTSRDPFWCNGHQIYRPPSQAQHSEGLLELPPLQEIQGQTVIIVKGEGGRHLLFDELTRRGAEVKELACYNRLELSQPVATQGWQTADIKTIIVTSGEQIQAMFSQYPSSWLTQLQWIVPSERLVKVAQASGINQITQAKSASDSDLIDAYKHDVME